MIDPRPAVVSAGAFVPAEQCYQLWELLRADQARRRRNGLDIRPDEIQLTETIRDAAMSAMSADVAVSRSRTDTAAGSKHTSAVSTSALADRLGCSPRHARRIARAEGVTQLTRNRWNATDIEDLLARR